MGLLSRWSFGLKVKYLILVKLSRLEEVKYFWNEPRVVSRPRDLMKHQFLIFEVYIMKEMLFRDIKVIETTLTWCLNRRKIIFFKNLVFYVRIWMKNCLKLGFCPILVVILYVIDDIANILKLLWKKNVFVYWNCYILCIFGILRTYMA